VPLHASDQIRRDRDATADIAGLVNDGLANAVTPHPGPVFLDFPLDVVLMEDADASPPRELPRLREGTEVDESIERAAALRRAAAR
jgi:acetolactate synthase-1/2/3 large subunit